MENYTDEIIAKFPNLTCSVLDGGVNVYYHKYVITIWWRKQTYCDTKKHKWVRFTSLEAIIQVIETASMPKAKKVPAIAYIEIMDEKDAMQPIEGMISVPVIKNYINYGVQQCIDHINRKRDFIMQSQPDNKLAAFCLSLSQELTQYL